MVLSAGFLTLSKGMKAWAKGLPSDPGGVSGGASSSNMIALPPFEKSSSFPFAKALLERKSSRSYDASRILTQEEISRLLWATAGMNRTDGRRTIASANARYPVDVMVAMPGGVFRYEPGDHKLVKVISDDIRPVVPVQAGFKNTAMIVLYVINRDKVPRGRIEYADIEIGSMGQSLYLEAAALGIGSCFFANINYDTTIKVLGIKENQILRIAQAVG
jgi:nitroreductase